MPTSPLVPRLHLDSPDLNPALLSALSHGLSGVREAAAGDLVGYAVGHCLPRPGLRRAVSERMCAFQGGERGCEATVMRLSPQASHRMERIEKDFLAAPELSKSMHAAMGTPFVQIDSKHFRACMIAIGIKSFHLPVRDREIRIYASSVRTREIAEELAAEIREIFKLLAEAYDAFSGFRFALPDADAFLRPR